MYELPPRAVAYFSQYFISMIEVPDPDPDSEPRLTDDVSTLVCALEISQNFVQLMDDAKVPQDSIHLWRKFVENSRQLSDLVKKHFEVVRKEPVPPIELQEVHDAPDEHKFKLWPVAGALRHRFISKRQSGKGEKDSQAEEGSSCAIPVSLLDPRTSEHGSQQEASLLPEHTSPVDKTPSKDAES